MRRCEQLALLCACLTATTLTGLAGCKPDAPASVFTGPSPAALAPRAAPECRIFVDGKELRSPLQYIGARQGQDIYLGYVGIALAIRPERELKFTWEGQASELLFLQTPQQPKRLVGVRVKTHYEKSGKIELNPLATLDATELRGLWGVELERWSDEIAAQVAGLDLNNCWLTVSFGLGASDSQALPRLPAGVTMLRLQARSSESLTSVQSLRQLPNLRALSVHRITKKPLDCELLQSAEHLSYLNLAGEPLRNPQAIGNLAQVVSLDLKYCDGLADLSFAKSLGLLEELDVSHTKITDLSPLSGLPRLQTITANMTPVRWLPTAVTNLQRLEILSTKVSSSSAAAFQTAHPQCEVKRGWQESLVAALKSADRLRVRSGGTCHRNEEAETTLFETNDARQIQAMLAGLEILEERSGFHCMCCGEPSFEFYQQDQLLATVGFHHGQGLRWVEGWPGDAALNPKSASFLVDWLAARSVPGPRQEREAEAERERAAERKLAQATAAMSPSLASAFRRGPEPFQAALARELPDEKQQVAVWLRVLGTSNDSWSQLEAIEYEADKALQAVSLATLEPVVAAALASDDRLLRRGAARLWMSWQSPLEDWRPSNIAELHSVVLDVQQQSHYYPLRMEALGHLAAWSAELTPAEVARRLEAGFYDPAPQVRRQAMLIAGRMKHHESIPNLLKVLEGETLPARALADVPKWEQTDVPEGFGDVAEGCSDQEVAALALGWLDDRSTKPAIDRLLPASEMKDVALALLGQPQRLTAEHFKTASRNQQLQLAAVEAVIRAKGRFGLKLALDYRQASDWWEEARVAEQLSQMLLSQDAPGQDMLADCKSIETLRQWFDKYGSDYLARFEK